MSSKRCGEKQDPQNELVKGVNYLYFQQNKQKIFFWTLQAVTFYNCYLNGDAEGIFTPSSIPKQAHFSVFKFPILINSIYCS